MITRRTLIRIAGCGLASSALDRAWVAGAAVAKPSARPLHYPKSGLFSGVEWQGKAKRYPGTRTDMHWWTWGADDALYLVDDDGQNFDLQPSWKHLMRITGVPPNYQVAELTDFPDLLIPGPEKTPDGKKRSFNDTLSLDHTRYVCGALAVGNRLHVTVYDYNDLTSDKPWNFMDRISRHGGVAGIMYSDDSGKTWQNVPSKDEPSKQHSYFLGPRFAGLQFVGFGPGYTGVPKELGGFVYAISNDSNWASGNHIFLARVPREKVTERSAWEFCAGDGDGRTNAAAVWVTDEEKARPILTDLGHVGHPDMSYNQPLGRFFLSVFSDAIPHNISTHVQVAFKTWDKRAELQIYEGPSPWGPWAVVHNDPWWEGPHHVPYLPHLPSKWWSSDGMAGILLFSGDYTSDGPTPHEDPSSYYGVTTRPFRLVPRRKGDQ